MVNFPKTISAKEAAEILGISLTSVYNAVKRGEIPVIKIGSIYRIPVIPLQRLLKETKPDPDVISIDPEALAPRPCNAMKTMEVKMANFEEILNKPASEIKAPPAYPVGTYHCLVDGPPAPGKSSQKQTDFLKFKFKILAPFDGVDAAQAAEQQIVGKIIESDYYITEAAAWRLKDMLVDHLGIEEANKTMTQLVAEAPGKQLLVKLRHELSQDGKRVYHRVESTAHV